MGHISTAAHRSHDSLLEAPGLRLKMTASLSWTLEIIETVG